MTVKRRLNAKTKWIFIEIIYKIVCKNKVRLHYCNQKSTHIEQWTPDGTHTTSVAYVSLDPIITVTDTNPMLLFCGIDRFHFPLKNLINLSS